MLKKLMIGGLALLGAEAASAIELFESNPTQLYPPGCMSTTRDDITTPTGSRQVYGQDILTFTDSQDTSRTVNVQVEIFRRGCREPGRSVLYVTFEMISAGRFLIPEMSGLIGEEEYELRLVGEPSSFEDSQIGRSVPAGTYEFIVDGLAESRVRNNTNVMLPSQYSGAFTLQITDILDNSNQYSIPLPVWNDNIAPARTPLMGRLSGVWVVEGAEDQGFVISFSEFATEDQTQQLVFFSWYTFDAEGNLLWLTAAEFFEVGASEVVLPIELVTNGEFLGSKTADREVIDNATLRVETCNEVTLTYDLGALGLGSGSITLRRLFALETAGYACRDLEARLESL